MALGAGSTRVVLALVVLVIVVSGGFAAYYLQTSSSISQLQGQVNAGQAQVSTMEKELNADNVNLTTLKAQLAASQLTINNLNAQVNDLQNQAILQLSSIANLTGKVDSLRNQLNSLQERVSNLSSILSLSQSTPLVSQYTFTLFNAQDKSWTFRSQIAYAGYLSISYDTAYVPPANSLPSAHVEVDTGNTTLKSMPASFVNNLIIPVVPGQTYNVQIWNDVTTEITVTVAITYVY